jgi:hypothetical protein
VDDDHHFNQQIDQWVEKDLSPPPHPAGPLHEVFEADEFDLPASTRTAPAPAERSGSRHDRPCHTVSREWPRDVRSETYLRRLSRKVLKAIGIAILVAAAFAVVVMGVSLVGESLTPPILPTPPRAPARALPAAAAPVPVDASLIAS